ncbi:protein PGR isoform X1 [Dendrobium catenatum]|uniref:protein PGR isoform X1 n=2 Tax=Dendrobium catenatum TaxID=906689 RepID=UPI0009F27BA3|nr:protein PGR isoform X1 [Dendrobium catenatum]
MVIPARTFIISLTPSSLLRVGLLPLLFQPHGSKTLLRPLPAKQMDDLWFRFYLAVLISSVIAARAFRRKSVDLSGVAAGIPVMVIHTVAGYRFAVLLLVFFFSSSKLTRVGEEKKRAVDAEFKEGGQRNWRQVLANSGIASILLIILATLANGQDRCLDTNESKIITSLMGGIIGHYACCNGDTWSSELGILSVTQPRLITTFKTVPKGTNGGITLDGLLAATVAGIVIGVPYILVGLITAECSANVAWRQLLVVPVAAFAGLFGSLVDSFIGATLQFSGYCSVRKKVVAKPGPTVVKISGRNILDNNSVNMVSVLLTSLLTSIACIYIF